MFDVVIGRGLLRGGLGQRRRPQLDFVCVMELCGVSVATERTTGKHVGHNSHARFVLCFLRHTPYFCAVEGQSARFLRIHS